MTGLALPYGLGYVPVADGAWNVTDSAVQGADVEGQLFVISALSANTGNIYLGMDASIAVSVGIELQPGDTLAIPMHNLNLLFAIAASSGDDLGFVAFACVSYYG